MNSANMWLVMVLLNSTTNQLNHITIIGPLIEPDCQDMYQSLPSEAPLGYKSMVTCESFSKAFAEVNGCRLQSNREGDSDKNMGFGWMFVDCPKYAQEHSKNAHKY